MRHSRYNFISSIADYNWTMRILVTGSNGFIGKTLLLVLPTRAHKTVATVRAAPDDRNAPSNAVAIGDIDATTNWSTALHGADALIHLAARVHVMRDTAIDPLAEFRRVNTEGTLNLARQAAAAGVRRFIFLSTIGVSGNSTPLGTAFSENDAPLPHDPYSVSKHEAEVGLRAISKSTGMEIVIIRPTLVHGSKAPGNFGKLTRLVAKGLPLPLASIDNRRSLVGIDNLVDFIVTCLEHPAAANETFLVSDGEDLSTPDLIRRMARAIDRPARLLPVPKSVLMAAAAMLGKRDMAQRLCGSLQVDISKARALLGWNPPVSVDEGLRRAVK
jgi:nucleoside-diphosphate-sugar epimerase